MKKTFLIIAGAAWIIALAACGSGDSSFDYSEDVPTNLPPTVARIDPATGPVGTAVTVFGFGFSDAAPDNVLMVGSGSIAATAYTLLPNPTSSEIESISATIPAGAAVGADAILVIVDGNPSNADITFTVTP